MKTALALFVSVLIFCLSLEAISWALMPKRNAILDALKGPTVHEIDTWEKFLTHPRFARMTGMLGKFRAAHPELLKLPEFDYPLLFEDDDFQNNGESNRSPFYRGEDLNPNVDDFYSYRGASSGKLKFRVRYATDENGFRRTPFTGRRPERENLILMGCSFTFGHGVNQEETFAATLAREFPDRNVFNFGIPASSVANILKRIYKRQADFFRTVPKDSPTDVVFTFIDDHMRRILGNSEFLAKLPHAFELEMYFYLDGDGRLQHLENFSKAPSRYVLRAYGHTNFARFTGIELPLISTDELRLTARLFRELRDQVRTYVPRLRKFYVAIYPGNNAVFPALRDFLKAEGIEFIDYSELDYQRLLNWHENLVVDYHPSAIAHELYGKMLAEDLRSLETRER